MKKFGVVFFVLLFFFGISAATSVFADTTTLQVNNGSNDVNEDGTTFTSSTPTVWLGSGKTTTASYAGFRFTGVNVPKGAIVNSAKLQVYSTANQWISLNFNIYAENSGNSLVFSTTSKPSQRSFTTNFVTHSSNTNWATNTWITLDEIAPVVQTVIDRSDWTAGNSISIILKGTGAAYARKNVRAYEGGSTNAAKLLLTYTLPTTSPTPVPLPTSTPMPVPTNTPAPTLIPTPTDLPIPSPTPMVPTPTPTSFPTPTPVVVTSYTTSTMSVGQGGTDVTTRNLIRTVSDKLYMFANKQYSNNLYAYWSTAGLPTSSVDFTGQTLTANNANIISVDAIYGNGNVVHVVVNDQSGNVKDFPFSLVTNTFLQPLTIATDSATVSGDYVGSGGVSGMVDLSGQLQIAYETAAHRIVHRIYSYDQVNNALQIVSETSPLDVGGEANHPHLLVSPTDNSISVFWVNQSISPAKISVRTRDTMGVWSNAENISQFPVWTSNFFGKNIDQGPSGFIDSSGFRHIVYMENYDQTGNYGKVHYVNNTTGVWTDTALNSYTHDPALAVNSVGDLFVLGHGHPQSTTSVTDCKIETNMCVVSRQGGVWSEQKLVLKAAGTDNYDTSPSVKWSAVGWNRPETVEFVFSNVPSGNYNTPNLVYGQIQINGVVPTPTPPPPTPTSVPLPTPTEIPLPTPTDLPMPTPTNIPMPTPTDVPLPTPTDLPLPTPTAVPTSVPTPTPLMGPGNGLYFDGVNDEVRGPIYPGSNESQTMEVWVRPNINNAYGIVLSTRNDGDDQGWIIELRNGQAEFWVADTAGVDTNLLHTGVTMTANQWYHIAATYDQSTQLGQLFVNGVPSQSKNMGVLSIGPMTRMGTFGAYASFNGMADEVRISKGIRYTGTFVPDNLPYTSDQNTAVLLHFDETNGQDVIDWSGKGVNLVLGRDNSVETFDPVRGMSNAPLSGVVVPTPTLVPTPIPTAVPTPTTVPPTPTPTAIPSASTVTLQVTSGLDDVNENGTAFSATDNPTWLGNSQSATASYTGLRFTGVNIPKGAIITSAKLQVYSPSSQWIGLSMNMYLDNSGNSLAFSSTSKPSQRSLTTGYVTHSSNTNWTASTWITLDEMASVVQSVVNRTDWQPGNSLAVIVKGTGSAWSRKMISSYESSPINSAKLVISYNQ